MDITKIPIDDLKKDREESIVDIKNCETAIMVGVITYSGGSVQERLDVNKKIIKKIDEELERRLKEATP